MLPPTRPEGPDPAPRRRGPPRGALKEEEGCRKRKRCAPQEAAGSMPASSSRASKAPKLSAGPFAKPPDAAHEIPRCHLGFDPQHCPDGWAEPNAPAAATAWRALPGRRRRRQQEGGEATPTSEPEDRRRRGRPRLLEQYARGPLLGRGGYGSVYAGTRKCDGLPVAIKYVSKAHAEDELDMPGQDGPLPLEVALMRQVTVEPRSPHLLQMLDWFDQPSRYIMVLERPEPCQDLVTFCQDRGGFLSEGLARSITTQLLGALLHCHKRGVLHRDVKPENLLIQTDSHCVKLIDFGCGDLLKHTVYKEFAGTLEFTPPEWFSRGQYLAGPATVWSVGVTLFSLVCGFPPFNTIQEISRGRVAFPKGISAECRHLIRWCLRSREEDRPSLEEIQLHKWLS